MTGGLRRRILAWTTGDEEGDEEGGSSVEGEDVEGEGEDVEEDEDRLLYEEARTGRTYGGVAGAVEQDEEAKSVPPSYTHDTAGHDYLGRSVSR